MSKAETRTHIEDIAIEGTELHDEHLRLISGGLRSQYSKTIVITQGGEDSMEYPDAPF
jgi:hypothetical protein